MVRRQPTLLDRFLWKADRNIVTSRTIANIQARARLAHPYVLTPQAAIRVGEVARDVPELLATHCQFARAPFDVTWIEFWFPTLWETITGQTSDADSDGWFGILIDHDTVYVVIGGDKSAPSRPPYLMPMFYNLHTPWSEVERRKFADQIGIRHLAQLDAYLWGSSFNSTGGISLAVDDRHPQAAMRNTHSVGLLPLTVPSSRIGHMLGAAAGELRNIVAILLLLNRPSLTEYVADVAPHRGFISGTLRNYVAHTVVNISLNPIPTLRLIGTPYGDTISRRRHEVCGSWCNNYDAREYEKIGCVHEWLPDQDYTEKDDPTQPDHYVCRVCNGKRWWRNQTVRGDATKGWVRKTYSVSARTQQHRGS